MNMVAPIGVKLAFGSLMAVGLLASQHHAHAAAEPAGVQKLNTLSDGTAQVQSYITAEVDGIPALPRLA